MQNKVTRVVAATLLAQMVCVPSVVLAQEDDGIDFDALCINLLELAHAKKKEERKSTLH